MNAENPYEGIKISKENRRNTQEAEKQREITHPFKLHFHIPKRKDRERRAHNLERKALRG